MTQRLSASRLNNFLGCAHHAALWLDGVEAPEEDNPSLELLRNKGFEHEAKVLASLEATHGPAEGHCQAKVLYYHLLAPLGRGVTDFAHVFRH